MKENFSNILFFLGVDYFRARFLYDQEDLLCKVDKSRSAFFKHLPLLIRSLLRGLNIDELESFLCISKYFLFLLKKNTYRGGFCLICDEYYSKIIQHLRKFHYLGNSLRNEYLDNFRSSVKFKLPKEFIKTIGHYKKKIRVKAYEISQTSDSFPLLPELSASNSADWICKLCNKAYPEDQRLRHIKIHDEIDLPEESNFLL